MDAAGQLAQLGQRLLRLLAGRLDQRLQLGIGPGHPAARHAERQRQRDQPLLRPVVQVALEPAAFGVPGLHDPGPGRPHQLQLRLDLGLQPGVLQGHARRRRGQPDQLRLEVQARVVDQHGLPRPGQRDHRPPRIRPRRVHRQARGVGEAVPVPERELQGGIAQRPGQRVPQPAGRRARFQVDDRGAERAARRPGAHRADHEQDRAEQGHQRRPAVEDQVGQRRQAVKTGDVSDQRFRADHHGDPHQRHHGLPRPAARRPPVPDDQDHDDDGERGADRGAQSR